MGKKNVSKIASFILVNRFSLIQLGVLIAVVIVPVLIAGTCEAATAGTTTTVGSLPWATGVNKLKEELTGPLPRIAGMIAVAVSAIMLSFSEMSGMSKKAIQIVFGLGIAINAPSLVSALSGVDVSGCLF